MSKYTATSPLGLGARAGGRAHDGATPPSGRRRWIGALEKRTRIIAARTRIIWLDREGSPWTRLRGFLRWPRPVVVAGAACAHAMLLTSGTCWPLSRPYVSRHPVVPLGGAWFFREPYRVWLFRWCPIRYHMIPWLLILSSGFVLCGACVLSLRRCVGPSVCLSVCVSHLELELQRSQCSDSSCTAVVSCDFSRFGAGGMESESLSCYPTQHLSLKLGRTT